MKLIPLLLVSYGLLCAQTPIGVPRVGVLDYYGLHKISPERIQRVLATKEGDPFPTSKGDVEERIEKIPGVVRSHLEAVCCDSGKAILFVGIEERGAAHFDFRSAPDGDVRLPGDVVAAYKQFLTALEAAGRSGTVAEDLRSGHSLMADPDARRLQERFAVLAGQQLPVLREVLRNSADEEHRAIAAYVIGYAPRKREVVDDLQLAIQDPDDAVRHNAMRALAAISVLASRDPGLEIQVSATWFVEMLNSIVWTDRTKAVAALLTLTDSRPERMLALIRERAMPSLAEMARWKSLTHAIGPYMLLGRAAGMSDQQIQDTWSNGRREATIAKALKSARK
ncbi:MAG TPA: HEAT repeat domain-containing protein [Bryobacteraceae bacterium]|nr:HEAT repeat domain-containing protein [Bryobacteraceae bacterium]